MMAPRITHDGSGEEQNPDRLIRSGRGTPPSSNRSWRCQRREDNIQVIAPLRTASHRIAWNRGVDRLIEGARRLSVSKEPI